MPAGESKSIKQSDLHTDASNKIIFCAREDQQDIIPPAWCSGADHSTYCSYELQGKLTLHAAWSYSSSLSQTSQGSSAARRETQHA